jgi:hypothetical protein
MIVLTSRLSFALSPTLALNQRPHHPEKLVLRHNGEQPDLLYFCNASCSVCSCLHAIVCGPTLCVTSGGYRSTAAFSQQPQLPFRNNHCAAQLPFRNNRCAQHTPPCMRTETRKETDWYRRDKVVMALDACSSSSSSAALPAPPCPQRTCPTQDTPPCTQEQQDASSHKRPSCLRTHIYRSQLCVCACVCFVVCA